jgi:hypothetical protein
LISATEAHMTLPSVTVQTGSKVAVASPHFRLKTETVPARHTWVSLAFGCGATHATRRTCVQVVCESNPRATPSNEIPHLQLAVTHAVTSSRYN